VAVEVELVEQEQVLQLLVVLHKQVEQDQQTVLQDQV
tara:strand:+ start:420 stop:530 length:111 start_codon:yes stop_codon:yes gene_type:complete